MNRKPSSRKVSENTDSDSSKPHTLTSAWIGVVGVLVGGVFGFGGSLLVFFQGANTQDTVAQNRVADIRRVAYSEFVAQTQSVRGVFTVFHNEVVNGTRGTALFKLYQDTVAPEMVKYARTNSSIELVAPPDVSAATHVISHARDQFSDLAFLAINDSADPSPRLPYPTEEFQAVLAKFDKAVRGFVSAAKASAL